MCDRLVGAWSYQPIAHDSVQYSLRVDLEMQCSNVFGEANLDRFVTPPAS